MKGYLYGSNLKFDYCNTWNEATPSPCLVSGTWIISFFFFLLERGEGGGGDFAVSGPLMAISKIRNGERGISKMGGGDY